MPANIFQVCPVGGDGVAGVSALRICTPYARSLALLFGLDVFPFNPARKQESLVALASLRKQQPYFRIGSIVTPMLRLAILKARRTMRMNAAADISVAILPIQPFSKAIPHVSVKAVPQFGNRQQTLEVSR